MKGQIEITTEQFNALSAEKPFMVKIWATWCSPCKALGPVIDTIIEENPDKDFTVYSVDADKNSDLCQQLNIRAVPTMLFFNNGVLANTLIGNQPKAQILQVIDGLL